MCFSQISFFAHFKLELELSNTETLRKLLININIQESITCSVGTNARGKT